MFHKACSKSHHDAWLGCSCQLAGTSTERLSAWVPSDNLSGVHAAHVHGLAGPAS